MRVISLKTKMAVAVSLLVIVPILAMSYFTFSYFEQTFKETIADQEFTLLTTMADDIDSKFDIMQSALVVTSYRVTPEVLADSEKAQAFLDAQTGLRSMFDNRIYLFSVTGQIIAESPYDFNRRGRDFSYRDYFRNTVATNLPIISEPYISTHSHRHPAIMLTAPVFDAEGRLIAILAGGLDLLKANFLGVLSQTRIGNSGYVYIYSTQRTIILHPEMGWTMVQDVPGAPSRVYDMAVLGFEGSAETVNLNGVLCLSTYKKLKSTNWVMAADHPVSEVYAPVNKARQYFIIAIVLGVALLLIGIWSVVGFLLRPLGVFTRHVKTLGDKEGQDRYSRGFASDEIGALAAAFNDMLGELDEQKASLKKSAELYRTVTDFASDMVFWRSPQGDILYISPNCERITGYKDGEFYASPGLLDEIVHSEDRAAWLAYAGRSATAAPAMLEFRIVRKDGEVSWISCSSRHVYSEKGEFCGLRGSHQDISDRKQAEAQLQFVSMHDSLTGFLNRSSFEKEQLAFESRASQPLAVILCDVDGLKFVNDTLGHHAGDELLVRVAGILQRCLPPGTLIYRVGGDEFTAVLFGTGQAVAEKVCEEFKQAIDFYNVGEVELPISVSVGFATGENRSADFRVLLKEADDAMYREKLDHSQSARSSALATLAKALDGRDFCDEGHDERLRDMAVALGRKAGLPEKAFDKLLLLAQFHDIGKIGIPDTILFKRGALTKREREIIERHAEIGYRMAISTPDLAPVAEFILKHHEWWDGQGYPLRLKGEAIPLECRILSIVDAYDAMTNDRPYRLAMDHMAAVAEIERGAGSQFDPRLVALFVGGFSAG